MSLEASAIILLTILVLLLAAGFAAHQRTLTALTAAIDELHEARTTSRLPGIGDRLDLPEIDDGTDPDMDFVLFLSASCATCHEAVRQLTTVADEQPSTRMTSLWRDMVPEWVASTGMKAVQGDGPFQRLGISRTPAIVSAHRGETLAFEYIGDPTTIESFVARSVATRNQIGASR